MISKRNVSLNLNVRGLRHSATLRINAEVRRLRREGREVYNLGLGQSPFPVPEPVVEALRANAARKDYLPVEGLPELREAVARYHRRKDQVDAQPDQILVGPGSKELFFLLQLCYYGELIVPTPCWVSYTPQSQIVGRHVRYVPTTGRQGWKMQPDALASALEVQGDRYRPRLLVLNYPANPTGTSYTGRELAALAKVAREYEVLILSDEIYGGLHYTGDHVSIARHYPEGTILSNGISKWCGAGGWRLGTFRFPPDLDWLLEAMAAVASETYTSVSAPIQHAAVVAFSESAAMERYLAHARRILSALATEALARLDAASIHAVPPDGAFYLFPHFRDHKATLSKRGIRTDVELAKRLLSEAGVAALPGSEFQREASELRMRLSLVDFDGAGAMAKSESLGLEEPLPDDYLTERCAGVLAGIDRIVEWVG